MSFEPASTTTLIGTEMSLRFWGVRGSVPTPTAKNLLHGGNTTCLEVSLPGQTMILDAGTGIRGLGSAMQAATRATGGSVGRHNGLHLFLTHFHWDHIQGLPFFAPLYDPSTEITFYSMRPVAEAEAILVAQMAGPYFPVGFADLPARRSFVDVTGRVVRFGEAEVRNFPLNHPQGCHGYSIELDGRKLVFASDLEWGNPEFDPILLEAAHRADVLVFDAQFTPKEYGAHRGWGHSSWRHATSVASAAGVQRLILFHHDPGHCEEEMEAILRAAQAEFRNTSLAIEGETIVI